MNEVSLVESLGQVSASQTGRFFRDFLRGHVREMICEVMAAEVTELCGPTHAPAHLDITAGRDLLPVTLLPVLAFFPSQDVLHLANTPFPNNDPTLHVIRRLLQDE